MDVVLVIIGFLGVAAIVVAAYIFMVAARTYVSDDERRQHRRLGRPYVNRAKHDRRSGQPVTFPLTVNGVLITHDRRRTPDRRRAAFS